MGYQVVARKWRPQRFDEVIGQDHVTSTLKYAVLKNRTAPVYLFTGIRGTGKTTLARIWVKALNCLDLQPDGEPCNKCESCLEIAEGKSPDVIEIDGASNTSVDNVREIKENISYMPIRSKYRVYIIDEVHMLSKAAFNALLKTLEEPPAHTIFILATTDPQKIPTTVLSRCQRYDLKRLSLEDVTRQLAKILDAEKIKYDLDSLYEIAKEGEGSMRDSQTILEQLITFGGDKVTEEEVSLILGTSDKYQLRNIIQSISKHDSNSAVSFANDIYKNGKSIEKAAKDILHLLHHILLYSELKNTDFLDSPNEEKDWIKSISDNLTTPDWIRLFRFWNNEYETIKNSDFPLMIFETAVISCCTMPSMYDFTSFVKNISNLPIDQKNDLNKTTVQEMKPEAKIDNKQPEISNNSNTASKTETANKQDNPSEIRSIGINENIEQKTEPEITGKDDEKPNWVDFCKIFKESDPYFYATLCSCKYTENGSKITISIVNDIQRKIIGDLQREFDRIFGSARQLELVDYENGSSIFADEEKARKEDLDNKKNMILNSKAVKSAQELGFQLKQVSVE